MYGISKQMDGLYMHTLDDTWDTAVSAFFCSSPLLKALRLSTCLKEGRYHQRCTWDAVT